MARHLTFALGLTVAVSLARAATGCSSSSKLPGNPDASEDDGTCAAAGGTCLAGDTRECPNVGPESCGAGGVCCLVNANVGDAGEDASGGAACAAAGGFCASGDVSCGAVGPQDCGFAGGFCCLPSDAGPINGRIGGECTETGGQCLIGSAICAVPGPQSCGGITPAGLYCCLSNAAECGQPDATTYVCPEPADGGPSCQGGAQPPSGIPNFEALLQATDQDASYPAGCKVTFPGCNNGHVPYCTCSGSGPGSSGWTCFN